MSAITPSKFVATDDPGTKHAYLVPTSKALCGPSGTSRKRPRHRSNSPELKLAGLSTAWLEEDVAIKKTFDPETVRPTQWLGKLLNLTPKERNAFVVAWVIEKVGESLAQEGAVGNQRWCDVGVEAPAKRLGPRQAIQYIQ